MKVERTKALGVERVEVIVGNEDGGAVVAELVRRVEEEGNVEAKGDSERVSEGSEVEVGEEEMSEVSKKVEVGKVEVGEERVSEGSEVEVGEEEMSKVEVGEERVSEGSEKLVGLWVERMRYLKDEYERDEWSRRWESEESAPRDIVRGERGQGWWRLPEKMRMTRN